MPLISDRIPCPDCGRWNILWNDCYSCGCGFAGYRMQVYYEDLIAGYAFVYRWFDGNDVKILHQTVKVAAKPGCDDLLATMTKQFKAKTLTAFAEASRVAMVRLAGETPERAEEETAKLLAFTTQRVGKKGKAKA